jgi:hypothetical protein
MTHEIKLTFRQTDQETNKRMTHEIKLTNKQIYKETNTSMTHEIKLSFCLKSVYPKREMNVTQK